MYEKINVNKKFIVGNQTICKNESIPTVTDEIDESPLLTIVTAFSANHLNEGAMMVRSLIHSNFTGPLFVYLMQRPNEVGKDVLEAIGEFKEELQKTPLNATIIHYQVIEEYTTYCFKPKIVQDFINHATLTNTLPKVLMWGDASTRYDVNPEESADALLRDGVDFGGQKAMYSMVQNTHPDTYNYFNMSPTEFYTKREIAATFFLVNLARGVVLPAVLNPWFDCAGRACMTCMAPPGANRKTARGTKSKSLRSIRHTDSTNQFWVFWCTNCHAKHTCNVQLNNHTYIHAHANKRRDRKKSIKEMNG